MEPRITEADPEWAAVYTREWAGERSILEVLRDIPAFSLLSQPELSSLAAVMHVRNFAPGEVVVGTGRRLSGFYVIRSGAIEAVHYQDDGSSETVELLGPGELLGEFGLLDDAPRSTSLVAAEPSELIGFFKPDLLAIMDTRPRTSCRILLRLSEEMARVLHHEYAALRASGWPSADDRAADSKTTGTGL